MSKLTDMDNKLTYRRRALLAALIDYQHDEIMQALWLLEESYGGQAILSTFALVNDLAQMFNLDKEKKRCLRTDLTRSMLHASNTDLPPDPLVEMHTYRARRGEFGVVAKDQVTLPPVSMVKASTSTPTASVVVESKTQGANRTNSDACTCIFLSFINSIVEQVHSYDAHALKDICAEFGDELPSASIGPKTRFYMETWCKNTGNLLYNDKMEENETKTLAHMLYICLCTNIGPGAADRVLSKAILVANQLPEARKFSPNKLL